jgi:hypothetical protein
VLDVTLRDHIDKDLGPDLHRDMDIKMKRSKILLLPQKGLVLSQLHPDAKKYTDLKPSGNDPERGDELAVKINGDIGPVTKSTIVYRTVTKDVAARYGNENGEEGAENRAKPEKG